MTLDIGTSNDKDEERKRETEIKRSTRLHSNRERGVINAATIGSASTSRMTLRGGEISDDGSAWNEKIMRIVAAIRSFLRSLGKRKSLLERQPLFDNSILETRGRENSNFEVVEEKSNESFRATNKFRR